MNRSTSTKKADKGTTTTEAPVRESGVLISCDSQNKLKAEEFYPATFAVEDGVLKVTGEGRTAPLSQVLDNGQKLVITVSRGSDASKSLLKLVATLEEAGQLAAIPGITCVP